MPLLSRKKQLTFVGELGPKNITGFYESSGSPALYSPLTTASYAQNLVFDASLNADIEFLDRDFIRDSISPLKQIAGARTASLAFTCELVPRATDTSATAKVELPYHAALKAVGMTEQNVGFRVDLTGATWSNVGSSTIRKFYARELVEVFNTAPASVGYGFVAKDVSEGEDTIYLDKDLIDVLLVDSSYSAFTGVPATGWKLVGQSSGAEVTLGTITSPSTDDLNWSYHPTTTPLMKSFVTGTLSGTLTDGDVIAFQDAAGEESMRARFRAYDSFAAVMWYERIRGACAYSDNIFTVAEDGTKTDTALNVVGSATTKEMVDSDPAPPAFYERGHTMAASMFEDGLKTTMLGARGSMTMNCEVNQPVGLAFTFNGCLDTDAADDDGGTGDYPMLTGVDYNLETPALFGTQKVFIRKTGGTTDSTSGVAIAQPLCLTSMTIDIGNDVTARQCAGESEGIAEYVITNRAGTVTMNPEATNEADIQFFNGLETGDLFRVDFTVGDEDGRRFHIQMPGLQLTSMNSGDRDGTLIKDLTFTMTGGDYALDGAAPNIASFGGDNELIIIVEDRVAGT